MCDAVYNDFKNAHSLLGDEDFSFLNEDLESTISEVLREGEYLMDEYLSQVETIDKLCELLEDNDVDYDI